MPSIKQKITGKTCLLKNVYIFPSDVIQKEGFK